MFQWDNGNIYDQHVNLFSIFLEINISQSIHSLTSLKSILTGCFSYFKAMILLNIKYISAKPNRSCIFFSFQYPILFQGVKEIKKQLKDDLNIQLGYLNHYLSESKWVGGEEMTVADFAIAASISTISVWFLCDFG